MNLRTLFIALFFIFTTAIAEAAPFLPTFYNVETSTLFQNINYYPNQGRGPQTLSIYRANGKWLSAGSFNTQAAGAALAGNYVTQNFMQVVQSFANQGYRPYDISVAVDDNGQPRFSAVWKKRGTELALTYVNMTDADFSSYWNSLVTQKSYRIADYAAYMVGGQKRHAAIFVKDGQGFYFYHGMNQAGFQQRFSQLAAQGYYPVSFNAVATPQGETYAGVWMKNTGALAMYMNMSASAYLLKSDQYLGQGYYLSKVQGYGNGTRFAAIWRKK